jgi:hypothetical protein
VDNWQKLKNKGTERKAHLDDSYYLHRFLADFRDLVSWVHDMKNIISADDLAKDVAGAEALVERHNEHKVKVKVVSVLKSSYNEHKVKVKLISVLKVPTMNTR